MIFACFSCLCTNFEVNLEDIFTRCKKYSSKLDISRSFIRIFVTHKHTESNERTEEEIVGHGFS